MLVNIYNAEACRSLDAKAIGDCGIGGFTLMRRAGIAAVNEFCRTWAKPCRVDVVCGAGNNGGDGYLVAAALKARGYFCRVYCSGLPTSEDARQARAIAVEAGLEIFAANRFGADAEVIVDALLGIGLSRSPAGEALDLINRINFSPAPVLSLDVPSGLNVNTGQAPGVAVNADVTVTFIGLKFGLMTGFGPNYTGRIVFADLGVPQFVYDSVPAMAFLCDGERLLNEIPQRSRCAHKGKHGHGVIIGGNYAMAGALRIASEAALRSGAGLVTAITRPEQTAQINQGRPELMVRGVDNDDAVLADLLHSKQVVGIGPGLGKDAWSGAMMTAILKKVRPLVIDADGLNWLAAYPQAVGQAILTPHPAEAARLLKSSVEKVQADRYQAVRNIATQYDAICVLKGCGTLISDGQSVYLCDRGNPGMASAGMGDCLTGVITALIAQGVPLYSAAQCGVWLHAAAADKAAAHNGMIGMLATDLIDIIRQLINKIY